MKQIRLKDYIYIIKKCDDCECPAHGHWHCFWGSEYPYNGFPKGCPLEEYVEENK